MAAGTLCGQPLGELPGMLAEALGSENLAFVASAQMGYGTSKSHVGNRRVRGVNGLSGWPPIIELEASARIADMANGKRVGQQHFAPRHQLAARR